MQEMICAEDVFDDLYGDKRTTIRKGRRDIQIGDMLFKSLDTKRECLVSVVMVSYCPLANVYISDLQNDGFKDHSDMWGRMKRFYPDLEFDTEVTVVKFTNKRFK